MRRPLFETGRPKLLAGGGGTDIILSLAGLPPDLQSRVVGLTLYAAVNPGEQTTLLVGAGDLDAQTDAAIAGYPLDADTENIQVVKLLDRYPMRGNVEVAASSTADVGDRAVFVFGYYQIEGERRPPIEYRPLQPDPSTVQRNYIAARLDGAGTQMLQAFTPTYIDVVKLVCLGSVDGDPTVVVADGEGVSALQVRGAINLELLNRIPFRAKSDQAVGGYAPGIHIVSGDADTRMSAWGMFTRG